MVLPPALSMDEYSDFIESSLRGANPVAMARQKAIEERILKPFILPDEDGHPHLITPLERAS